MPAVARRKIGVEECSEGGILSIACCTSGLRYAPAAVGSEPNVDIPMPGELSIPFSYSMPGEFEGTNLVQLCEPNFRRPSFLSQPLVVYPPMCSVFHALDPANYKPVDVNQKIQHL
jgi:hypothetical protein